VAADEAARTADDYGLVCVHVALEDRFGTGPVCGIRGQKVGARGIGRKTEAVFSRSRHTKREYACSRKDSSDDVGGIFSQMSTRYNFQL
jgi:hypothetical protein